MKPKYLIIVGNSEYWEKGEWSFKVYMLLNINFEGWLNPSYESYIKKCVRYSNFVGRRNQNWGLDWRKWNERTNWWIWKASLNCSSNFKSFKINVSWKCQRLDPYIDRDMIILHMFFVFMCLSQKSFTNHALKQQSGRIDMKRKT